MYINRNTCLFVCQPRTCHKYTVQIMGNRVKEFNTLPIESKQCIVIERYGDVFSRASHFEIPWRIVLISPMSYLGMKFVVFILKLSENVSLGKKSWVLLIK